ncbi:MAG: hypothetical protein BME93_04800 [Methanosarcinales archaeon Met12]|nr:MAG: hypothetical protein BME93_04800 [Methanosarcinales archaeon Met12]
MQELKSVKMKSAELSEIKKIHAHLKSEGVNIPLYELISKSVKYMIANFPEFEEMMLSKKSVWDIVTPVKGMGKVKSTKVDEELYGRSA